MRTSEMKLGQIVRHSKGFVGKVVKIKDRGSWTDVTIKITESNGNHRQAGEEYIALPAFLALVKEVDNSTKHNLVINVETNLDEIIEQTEELLELSEEMAEIKKEESVFECNIQGIKFKGTKSDFAVFVDGLSRMTEVASRL